MPQRRNAVLGRARETRAGHGHHHAPHDALGLGGDGSQAQAGDKFSQGVFKLAQELVLPTLDVSFGRACPSNQETLRVCAELAGLSDTLPQVPTFAEGPATTITPVAGSPAR